MNGKKNSNRNSNINYDKFSRQWFRNHPKDDREMFELIVMYFPAMAGTFIWAMIDRDSHNAQICIAFASLIVFLWFIIGRSEIFSIYNSAKRAVFDFSNARLNDFSYALMMGCGLLAVLSVLFVINLEVLSNSAVRIGAVAAFGLFTLLKQVFISFKK